MDVKAYSEMQAALLELATGWVQLQLTEALTVLCTEWLFSRQLSEVVRSLSTLFESPKGYAPASSKSSKPSTCQPGLNLIRWGQCLWSLYSIDGIWIKKYAYDISEVFYFPEYFRKGWSLATNLTDAINHKFPHSLQVKVDISLNGTHLFASGGVEAWLILESFLFLDTVFFSFMYCRMVMCVSNVNYAAPLLAVRDAHG